MRRTTSVSTPVAHLVGPGKVKIINGQLAFSAHGHSPLRLDPRALKTLLCYGRVGITDEAFQTLFRHNVEVAWLSPAGSRCRGRLVRADPSLTSLRILQYQFFSDEPGKLAWARYLVAAKLRSQFDAARHYQRHGSNFAGSILPSLQIAIQRCQSADSLDQLRGIEGACTAAWFSVFGQLLRQPWQFTQRTRRPPTDPVNALLSIGYTWLLTRAIARAEASGLEIYLGALHDFRPGRPSLACDLIEPLRVPAVDRWVLAICNQTKIAPDDFVQENGGFRLHPNKFGRVLYDWEDSWQNGEHEGALERLLADLVTMLRRGDRRTNLASNPAEHEQH